MNRYIKYAVSIGVVGAVGCAGWYLGSRGSSKESPSSTVVQNVDGGTSGSTSDSQVSDSSADTVVESVTKPVVDKNSYPLGSAKNPRTDVAVKEDLWVEYPSVGLSEPESGSTPAIRGVLEENKWNADAIRKDAYYYRGERQGKVLVAASLDMLVVRTDSLTEEEKKLGVMTSNPDFYMRKGSYKYSQLLYYVLGDATRDCNYRRDLDTSKIVLCEVNENNILIYYDYIRYWYRVDSVSDDYYLYEVSSTKGETFTDEMGDKYWYSIKEFMLEKNLSFSVSLDYLYRGRYVLYRDTKTVYLE